MNHSFSRRFAGCARLYGTSALQRFEQSQIAVIGIGGVGSWAVEALARSGIGRITLIDMDHVAESNINRQIHALESNLGKAKTEVMQQRLLEINPSIEVSVVDDFLTFENTPQLITTQFQFVIDCIDHFRTKAGLIYHCKRNKIKLITTGGAGGRMDPGQIKISDLSRSEGDPLLSRCRKELRQRYGFPKNIQRRFEIPCVYSSEQPAFPTADGNTCFDKKQSASSTGLSCATGLGSGVTVTATFGLFAAGYVLRKL